MSEDNLVSIDYNNLEGKAEDVQILVVSVVGDRIVNDIGGPGYDVWFLIRFWCLGEYVRCLTKDGEHFYPFNWTKDGGRGMGLQSAEFESIVGSDGISGDKGSVWADINDQIREFVGNT